jgi:hypothetical protein
MVERDLNAAWTAINAATMDDKERAKSFRDWTTYATHECHIDPWLRGHTKSSKQSFLLAFAARVRTGSFGNARQVGFQTVEKALRHVAQTLVLAGFEDPRRAQGAKDLDLVFSRLLSSYRNATLQ